MKQATERSLLEKMACAKGGVIAIRRVIGAAGEPYRRELVLVTNLVRKGHARWVNDSRQTLVQITTQGRETVEFEID